MFTRVKKLPIHGQKMGNWNVVMVDFSQLPTSVQDYLIGIVFLKYMREMKIPPSSSFPAWLSTALVT